MNRFLWSQKLQGVIVSSFFWGNIVSQIPGGVLVQKYGGKMVLLASTFLSTIVVALTPLAVFYGKHTFSNRLIQNIHENVVVSNR